ncbi:MAG TPA: hypothetical protein VFQ54_11450 [Thermomicrobiales bacterium]|nr:hypothetical protein [Thermomicrobiales bacterium]
MVQRKLGMYVANKIKDEIMASPKPGEAIDPATGAVVAAQDGRTTTFVRQDQDDLHGQIVRDADGNAIGRAFRVTDVAVYVIARDGRNPGADLTRAIQTDAAHMHFQTTPNGRITSIIYVADENPSATGLHGARADEV